MEIEDLLKYMLNFFQNIDKELEELNKKQSEWDIKQDELLHYIEIHKLNAAKSCKAIRQLKYIREERRKIKNERDIVKSIKDSFADKYKNKFIEKDIIQALKKLKELEKRQETPKYNYQFLTEEMEIKDGIR